jgi:polyhydroxyalkanoate synthesis regulator protein
MNDQLIKDFIEKYFNQALQSFVGYQQQVEEQIRRTHGLPAVFPSVSAWTRAMLEPFASAFGGGTAKDPTQPPAAAPPPAANQELHEVIRDLQQHVAELQQKRAAKKRSSHRRKKHGTRTAA